MAAAINNTLEDVLLLCGVPNDGILFNGHTKANRIANEVFNDDFNSCMDISHDDFETECKTYSGLTVNQGQIRLTPGTKRNIKAMIQWCRELIIVGSDPVTVQFHNNQQLDLMRRYKAHQAFRERSKEISTVAKPEKFTDDSKWVDWYPTFQNFLKSIPGLRGVPLSYVIRENETGATANNPRLSFLDNFVLRAPLNGDSYVSDNSEVHTYIAYFTSGNSIAESKITSHGNDQDGRADIIALKQHYEGVGINSLEVNKAENVITNLFYSGEKKPHMWWSEFEKVLNRSFAIIQKVENRRVHSNDMKLRILMGKIQADFLQQTKAALHIDMARTPMTLTYETAMTTFRNVINNKYPPNISSNNRTRSINENNSSQRGNPGGGRFHRGGRGNGRGRGRFGRGRSSGRGRGRSGRGNANGEHNNTKPFFINGQQKSANTWMAVTTSGKAIECHPKASYPGDIWYMIPRNDKEKIHNLRRSGQSNYHGASQSVISELSYNTQHVHQPYQSIPPNNAMNNQQHQISQAHSQLSLPPPPPPLQPNRPSNQVSIMGGRNEQASLRSRNPNHN